MFASGINLTIKAGKKGTIPVSREFLEALQSVEVTHADKGRSGFQIILQVGRSGSADLKDDPLLKDAKLKPGNRVILTISLNGSPQVLMDGLITHQQFSPSLRPGQSTFTLTGEDISIAMDRKNEPEQHPAENDRTIVQQLLDKYSDYKIQLEPPQIPAQDISDKAPSIEKRIPVKLGKDLEYIQYLAKRRGYVFYITPGPRSGQNTAYWGPPKTPKLKETQKALTVNMGGYTNVESIDFQHNALRPTQAFGRVQSRDNNKINEFKLKDSTRPPLGKTSPFSYPPLTGQSFFQQSGHTQQQAIALAQAKIDRSVDDAVKVVGQLDTTRYGAILQIRKLVGLRGVGRSFDGLYYVERVTHSLRPGEYKQSFTISREGLDSKVDRVRV